MKRAALYVRVSTQEQKNQGYSVDSQIDALREYCLKSGFEISGLYNDAGISARKRYTKRPALLQLLKDCEDGKIDIVLFTKLDRWFRSVADYYEVQSILDRFRVPWRAVWEDYETETSSGCFKVNIMLSIAQAEADRTSERIKAVNTFRRANGEYINGKAPTGYKAVNSALIKDKEHELAVEKFFEEYLRSFSVSRAHGAMKQYGLIVSKETAQRMLKNPTYYGNAYGYVCDPYISKSDWDRIQDVVKSRKTRRTKSPDRVYLFGGLIHCASCGCGFHSQVCIVKGDHGKKYYYKYYVCGRYRNGLCDNRKQITEKKLEKYLLDNLQESLNAYIVSCESHPQDCIDYAAEKSKLELKLHRIGDRYESGEISRADYLSKVNSIRSQISAIHPPSEKIPEQLPCNWKETYLSLDDAHKKSFWNSVLNDIVIDDGDVNLIF